MNWFIFALITLLAWGSADLFYKKGADEKDKYSHLKTSVMVGLVMGLHACYTLIFGGINYNFKNLIIYLPVSAMYILSMTVGYFGLRYLELSISSPIQNSSGAVTCLLLVIFLGEKLDLPVALAVAVICIAIFVLGLLEKKESDKLREEGDEKYRMGFIAFFMPIIYCVVDSLGTFFDGYYLDDFTTTPLVGVTEETFEDVANTSYELTFLICAILILIFLKIKKQKFVIKEQGNRTVAAVFETIGQFTYVYAMSGKAVVAAPMIASYSVVSMILSRIFLKEKLTVKQYICIAFIMLGILVLGIYDI
ncbi:MAG: GRP family sugar transporter [Oscillospiraceae bacterium]|nr:GRP family sugar transporter [Oscillospiraceae bacterium]